jgi:hypothetical protein
LSWRALGSTRRPRIKSVFGSFSSEKEQESSFSEEKEAKRLLFLVLSQRVSLLLAPARVVSAFAAHKLC